MLIYLNRMGQMGLAKVHFLDKMGAESCAK